MHAWGRGSIALRPLPAWVALIGHVTSCETGKLPAEQDKDGLGASQDLGQICFEACMDGWLPYISLLVLTHVLLLLLVVLFLMSTGPFAMMKVSQQQLHAPVFAAQHSLGGRSQLKVPYRMNQLLCVRQCCKSKAAVTDSMMPGVIFCVSLCVILTAKDVKMIN